MAMSTFQKVTLATCLVLCVALLLPKMLLSRGRKDAAERPDGSGHNPPMMHHQVAAEGRGGPSRAHKPEAAARAKGAGTGVGTGGKSNLAGQIIPVYGFGILVYILYILFKITSKGSSKPSEGRFPSVRSENMKRKITDFELTQLQEKLRETELVMEKIVSKAHHSPDRVKGFTSVQEENLLQQLTEITRVMQESLLVDNMAPEKKNQDVWEDHPQEPQHYCERSHRCCQHSQEDHGPQTETEPERTQTDKDHPEDVPAGATGGAEREKAEDVRGGEEREDGSGPTRDLDGNERPTETGGQIDLGVPEEDLAGVLKELELSLKMTSIMEQEKMEDLSRNTGTEISCSAVRRRNKRRRAKKTSH